MKQAFTLIELLVVVLIIGILSAIALPQYQKAVARSRYIQQIVNIQALERAQKSYHLANGKFARDVNELGLDNPKGSCYPSGSKSLYCSVGGSGSMGLEWHASDDGKATWVCWSKDSIGKEVCQMYQRDWGGTRTYESDNNGVSYYYGATH